VKPLRTKKEYLTDLLRCLHTRATVQQSTIKTFAEQLFQRFAN
jgi:hypothetical protein